MPANSGSGPATTRKGTDARAHSTRTPATRVRHEGLFGRSGPENNVEARIVSSVPAEVMTFSPER